MSEETPKDENASRISRREFAIQATLTSVAAALAPQIAAAQNATSTVDSLPELPAASKAEADAALAGLLRKYGERFSEADKSELRRLIYQQQKSLDTLRKFPLLNGDEPGTVLHLERAETGHAE